MADENDDENLGDNLDDDDDNQNEFRLAAGRFIKSSF